MSRLNDWAMAVSRIKHELPGSEARIIIDDQGVTVYYGCWCKGNYISAQRRLDIIQVEQARIDIVVPELIKTAIEVLAPKPGEPQKPILRIVK